jgi:hypothetical protein
MADVKYIITASADGAIREFKQVDGAIDDMKGTTERGTRSFKGMWKQMAVGAAAIAGIVGALRGAKGLIGSFMDVAIQTEQYEIQLKTLLGSQEKATQAFSFFRDVAASLPYTLEEVIQSGTRLAAINVPFEGWLPKIADLASAIGMDLPQATDQMARALKGGLGAADLFREKGVSAMIKEFAKLEKGISDISKLSMPELQQVLWDFTEQFEGASEEMSRTWKGITSMLADKWFQFRDAVMQSGVFETLKEGLSEFNKKLDEFVESGKMEEWANNTARAVLQSFRAILQGVQGMIAGIQILKAAWADLNVAINTQVMKFYQKVLPAFYLLSQVSSEVKEETIKLVKEYAELLIQTEDYSTANKEATDKAADLINAFDDMIRFLDRAINSTKTMKTESGKLADTLAGSGSGGKPSVKKAIDSLIIGHDLWGKAILTTADFYKTLRDTMESHVFKYTKKKLFDLKEYWENVNQQIEAEWIRGISSMITEFKNFMGALDQFLNTMFRMFADTIGKIVVEWVKGVMTMKQAWESFQVAVEAFSVFFAIHVMQGLLTHLGILKDQVDAEVQAILDKLEQAKRKGEEILDTIRKGQLAPGEGAPDGTRGIRGGTWLDLLNKIPDALSATLDAIRNLLRKKVDGDVTTAFLNRSQLASYQKRLDRFTRITLASFSLMIEKGMSFFDALQAMKEPLEKLRDRYRDIGRDAPAALQPILEMFEKMEKRPGLFRSMSGLLDILKAFNATGAMTQQTLLDLANSTKSFVRQILGVTGNLRDAIGNMKSLTQEQILMLAPLLQPFLEASKRFGLKLPAWLKDLINKTGLKVEEQPINKVPPLLDRIRQRMGRETTRIVKAIGRVEGAIMGLPSGQHGLDFHSGSRGGLVRYHPNERITVTPNISLQPNFNMNMQSTPVIVQLDGRMLIQALAKHSVEMSRDGQIKWHPRSLASQ